MDSEGSEGSTKVDAVISKQQRVRDNQRRSRARRREYLAELESQLQQYHITCREAELQRIAFAELQAENARLRDLLKNAGISLDNVETSGKEAPLQQPSGHATASFRQLKPKLFAPEITNPPPAVSQKPPGSACCSTPSPSSSYTPHQNVSAETYAPYDPRYNHQLMAPPTLCTATAPAVGLPKGLPTSSYEWYLPPQGQETLPPREPSFVCHVFRVPPSGPLCTDDSNSISCSVAKDMIAQYDPTPEEMENIVARLSMAFSRPLFPGESCRVNKQVLFQILYEMNSNQDPRVVTGRVIDTGQDGL